MDAAGGIIVGQEFERAVKPPVVDYGPLFQHAALCQLGLPRSRVAGRLFERRSGGAIFAVEGGYWFDGKARVLQPVPYGVMPRLVMFHICREAVRTRSPVIDVLGSVSEYVRHLGLSKSGQALQGFRRQTIALASCRMEVCYVTARGPGQLKTDPIRRFEAFRLSEDGRHGLWPGELELSGDFFAETLDYAIALDPDAVHALRGSALALDVYSWMAARLSRITQTYGIDVSWPALKEQFGHEYRDVREFRRDFLAALKKVKAVYPQARVEVIQGTRVKPGGLRLLPSPRAIGSGSVGVKAIAAPQVEHEAADVELTYETTTTTGAMRFEDVGPDAIRSIVRFTGQRWSEADVRREWEQSHFPRAPDRDHDIDRNFKNYAIDVYRRLQGMDSAASDTRSSARLLADTMAAAQELAPGMDIDVLVEKFFAWNASKGTQLVHPDKAFLKWLPKFVKGGKDK